MFNIDTLGRRVRRFAALCWLSGSASCIATTEEVDPTEGERQVGTDEGEDPGWASALAEADVQARSTSIESKAEGNDIVQRQDRLTVSRSAALSAEAKRELATLNESTSYYSHTTYMNEATGTRRTDCSGFVGYAVRRIDRAAFELVPHPR